MAISNERKIKLQEIELKRLLDENVKLREQLDSERKRSENLQKELEQQNIRFSDAQNTYDDLIKELNGIKQESKENLKQLLEMKMAFKKESKDILKKFNRL